jgi:hypothetical protein
MCEAMSSCDTNGGALGTCVVFLKSPGRIGLTEGSTLLTMNLRNRTAHTLTTAPLTPIARS